jgi:hypothetical protein
MSNNTAFHTANSAVNMALIVLEQQIKMCDTIDNESSQQFKFYCEGITDQLETLKHIMTHASDHCDIFPSQVLTLLCESVKHILVHFSTQSEEDQAMMCVRAMSALANCIRVMTVHTLTEPRSAPIDSTMVMLTDIRNRISDLSTKITTPITQVLPSSHSVWVVDSNVNEACRKANPGDYIIIKEGIYHESLMINKTLTIMGTCSPDRVVITHDQDVIRLCMDHVVGSINIAHVTISQTKSRTDQMDCCINISGKTSASVFIEDCVINGGNGAAIVCNQQDGDITIRSSRISASTGCGIMFSLSSASVSIDDCEVFGHQEQGVVFDKCTSAIITVTDSHVYNNQSHGLLIKDTNSDISIQGNEIYENGNGIMIISDTANVMIDKNQIKDHVEQGVIVQGNAIVVIQNNVATGNQLGNFMLTDTCEIVGNIEHELTLDSVYMLRSSGVLYSISM